MNPSPEGAPAETFEPTHGERIPPEDVGARLDVWLTGRQPHSTRSQIKASIRNGDVRVAGRARNAGYRLRESDEVAWREIQEKARPPLEAESIALVIAYEDDALLVVEKPAGMVVHPAPGHRTGTLANALMAHVGDSIRDCGGEERSGIVHRLDKMTSGLLLVAKNAEAHEALTYALAKREIGRRYLAIAVGSFDETTGTIEAPIARRRRDRKRMGIVEGGRDAKTDYHILNQNGGLSLAAVKLHTGRTHQIRVHFQSIGRPLVGDQEYGKTKRHALASLETRLRSQIGPVWPDHQMLHAGALSFAHPISGERIEKTAPPPDDMIEFIRVAFEIESGELPQRLLDVFSD